MNSEIFTIGLGNNNLDTRKKSESDFISFWGEQAKKSFMVFTMD